MKLLTLSLALLIFPVEGYAFENTSVSEHSQVTKKKKKKKKKGIFKKKCKCPKVS